MGRYKEGSRLLTNWLKRDETRILKQLAGVVMKFEACSQWLLWKRISDLCPDITEKCLGSRITFKEVQELVIREQGEKRAITKNRLWGRGDVVNRPAYEETDAVWTIPVYEAYLELTGAKFEEDRRCFTDDEVRISTIRQKGKCAIPSCKAPFSPLNPPVGDHCIPVALGGKTLQENCIALCVKCNLNKGALPFLEYCAKAAMVASYGRRKLVS